MTLTRCEFTELPTAQCEHCTPGPRPTTTTTRPHTTPQPQPITPQSRELTTPQLTTLLNRAARALDRNQPANLHDYIQALTEPTTHHEPYTLQDHGTWITVRHRTLSPPLLKQLWDAVTATSAHTGGANTFASKPAARLDAIDVAQTIDQAVTTWLKRLNLPHPGDPITALKRAAANAGDAITNDARSWWIQARTVTGWDSPAWKLNLNS